jgi:hypothetical protein
MATMRAEMRVGDMTFGELEAMVETIIVRKVPKRVFEFLAMNAGDEDEAILEWLDQNMWTPPADGKSSLDYLREDRDN